jgi:hypothetical protein
MKKNIFLVILLTLNISLFAQAQIEKKQNDLRQVNEDYIKTYRIFPTQNTWHFIKLNTQTGQMWQVELSQKKSNQLETPINSLSLVEKHDEVDNRFTLYSTNISWNFFLLDQINGRVWQLNWSTKSGKSEIISIQ